MRFARLARFASQRNASVTVLAALSVGLLLSGCMLRSQRLAAQSGSAQSQAGQVQAAPAQAANGDGSIETVPFRTGVSSATVEKMGRARACTGGKGAGLVTEPGPVEVYRMQCENGKTFMARCELRQCRPM